MIDVLLVIRGLDKGGAERQLTNLAIALAGKGKRVMVATLYCGGAFSHRLAEFQISHVCLERKSRWMLILTAWRYWGLLRRVRPKVVYSFLSVANVLTALTRIASPGTKLVWGVRASGIDYRKYSWFAFGVYRVERLLAFTPHLIIANSLPGRDEAIAWRFSSDRVIVIANGIDTREFAFDAAGRRVFRDKWGIGPDELVVGIVARFDPMKGHEDFLAAISHASAAGIRGTYLCIGSGDVSLRSKLMRQAAGALSSGRVLFPEPEEDMAGVFSALDIVVSSSRFGEGFSNSLAEGMACERPCIATDIGDSARIVADSGWIVPAGDATALGNAIVEAVRAGGGERELLGRRARRRIVENFSVESCSCATANALGLSL